MYRIHFFKSKLVLIIQLKINNFFVVKSAYQFSGSKNFIFSDKNGKSRAMVVNINDSRHQLLIYNKYLFLCHNS